VGGKIPAPQEEAKKCVNLAMNRRNNDVRAGLAGISAWNDRR
jgi:hypothetical protein